MQVMQGLGFSVGIELDDTHATIIGFYVLDPFHQGRTLLGIDCPYAILVRFAVIPEACTFHLAKRGCDRRKVGVPSTLPVHIFEAHPFPLRNWWAIVVTQNSKALISQGIQFDMHRG